MWSKNNTIPICCSECRARVPKQAEACSECGHPVPHTIDTKEDTEQARSALEYKLIQLLGVIVFGVGVFAAFAESPIAATIALIIGATTYLSGLMGAWWNSGD